ncbi:MAG: hypothetical protein JNK90_14280 [Planctomycetaceae bacterium]|nr:hypothetical protein [Planctomycetaceae bacterium]
MEPVKSGVDAPQPPSEAKSSTVQPSEPQASQSSASQPHASGMQASSLALIAAAIVGSILLFLSVPSVIEYSRYIIPEEVANLMGRPGLKPDQAAQVTEQVRNYYVFPTRTFFPICAAIIAALFALAEAICWRKGGIILLALIVGPLVGYGIGYATAEITMIYFYNSGKMVNPSITDGLSMQTIALGLIGSGAGLAVGITARSILATITATIAGVLSGFVASCIFVIGTTAVFPLQDVFYPIPGMKLEATSDYGSIGIWSVALPICLAGALMAARKKAIKPTSTPNSTEKSPG